MPEPLENELRHQPAETKYDPEDDAFGDYEFTAEEALRATMSIHRWEDWDATAASRKRARRERKRLPPGISPSTSTSSELENGPEHEGGSSLATIQKLTKQLEEALEKSLRTISDIRGLSSEARAIAEARLPGWQAELLATALAEDVKELAEERRLYDLAISSRTGELVSDSEATKWCTDRLGELIETHERLGAFFDGQLRPSVASKDPPLIAHRARQLANLYRAQLKWSARLRQARASERWTIVFQELSWCNKSAVTQIAGLPRRIRRVIREARRNPPESRDGKPAVIPLMIELQDFNGEEFRRAMRAAMEAETPS